MYGLVGKVGSVGEVSVEGLKAMDSLSSVKPRDVLAFTRRVRQKVLWLKVPCYGATALERNDSRRGAADVEAGSEFGISESGKQFFARVGRVRDALTFSALEVAEDAFYGFPVAISWIVDAAAM